LNSAIRKGLPTTCAAILVDFDGTLYRQMPVRVLMAMELGLFGTKAISPLRSFRLHQERLREISAESASEPDEGKTPFERQMASACAESGMTYEQMQALVDEWMFRRPGKWLRRYIRWSLVRELQVRQTIGVKLALVSDYPVNCKLTALNLPIFFDTIVANGEPGGPSTVKPDPEGCLMAASRLGIAPRRCIFVGDREDVDGVAAQRAGMAFHLVR